jgi:4a-hydroxytetrahydrobiopterin dehydratase
MSISGLAKNKCVPCKGGIPPLAGDELEAYCEQLGSGWDCVDRHHLEKEYTVKGYPPAVAFANAVAGIAEEQDHHPDIFFTWGTIRVTIWTHKIDGLTPSDFYFAAKCEEAFGKQEG